MVRADSSFRKKQRTALVFWKVWNTGLIAVRGGPWMHLNRKALPTVAPWFPLLFTPPLVALQISQITGALNKIHTGINK